MCFGVKVILLSSQDKGKLVDFGNDGFCGSGQTGPWTHASLRFDQGRPGSRKRRQEVFSFNFIGF